MQDGEKKTNLEEDHGIYYRCEDRKELASKVATLVPIDRSLLALSENLDQHPKKRTVQPRDAFEVTAFKPGFEIVEFQTRLWNLSSSLLCEIDTTNGFLTSSSFR